MAVGEECILQLPATPTAAGMARSFVRRCWSHVDDAAIMDAVALCVSEMVTNALDHAVPPYELRLGQSATRLRVEVADASEDGPVVRQPTPRALRGRGMFLVDCTATAWGVVADGGGKTVWAEFATNSK